MQAEIANGEIQVIVGTHAIIQDAVEFENLGIAVIDEQHRFGVLQRAELRARGYIPYSGIPQRRFPAPRDAVYGDLDVS